MLGAAYMLTQADAGLSSLLVAAGAVLGIAFTYWTHRATGTADLDLNRQAEAEATYPYKVFLTSALHSASEGVAIGVAMYVNIGFGIFVALAIAVHNIPEAAILAAVLRSRLPIGKSAGIAVASNVSQILLATAIFAVVSAAPGILPWALGFALGALINLVVIELLPESYRQMGTTSIALVTLAAMGMVALLRWIITA